ncbi:hypothetical protein [Bordetella trematum]|uniref:hypothetical protein n=1 Tax=Bordetella trematum TaxID=123899 RepID=UPI0013FD6345|nr:hypothetical protein [Bordetella trematum]QIM72328.1 hypothetical protein EYB34_13710 [Bordetella trematum]
MKRVVVQRVGLLAGWAVMAACPAQTAGAWRKVSDAQFDRQYVFSMLPQEAEPGSRWLAYDAHAHRLVCCLVVGGKALSKAQLESDYAIPGPWVTDLINGWNLDAAPYRPQVQPLRGQGEYAGYEFKEPDQALGGLLLPMGATAASGPAGLTLEGRVFAVGQSGRSLADDDGGVVLYRLRPSDGGPALQVEIRFGIY